MVTDTYLIETHTFRTPQHNELRSWFDKAPSKPLKWECMCDAHNKIVIEKVGSELWVYQKGVRYFGRDCIEKFELRGKSMEEVKKWIFYVKGLGNDIINK